MIGDYTKQFSGQAGVKTVSVLRGFVFPKMLPPAEYGIWRLILVLWQYGRYLHPRTGAINFGGQRSPSDFVRINTLIQENVLESAWRHNVKKLLFLGSSCIYPKHAPQLIVLPN